MSEGKKWGYKREDYDASCILYLVTGMQYVMQSISQRFQGTSNLTQNSELNQRQKLSCPPVFYSLFFLVLQMITNSDISSKGYFEFSSIILDPLLSTCFPEKTFHNPNHLVLPYKSVLLREFRILALIFYEQGIVRLGGLHT